jgi:hypothetical protein
VHRFAPRLLKPETLLTLSLRFRLFDQVFQKLSFSILHSENPLQLIDTFSSAMGEAELDEQKELCAFVQTCISDLILGSECINANVLLYCLNQPTSTGSTNIDTWFRTSSPFFRKFTGFFRILDAVLLFCRPASIGHQNSACANPTAKQGSTNTNTRFTRFFSSFKLEPELQTRLRQVSLSERLHRSIISYWTTRILCTADPTVR